MGKDVVPLLASIGKFYIYIYRDPRPGKKAIPIYVGKGSGKRSDIHWSQVPKNPILRRILSKVRSANLEPSIEIVSWHEDETEAFLVERNLILKFGRLNIKTGSLCNLTEGGEGVSGLIMSARAKKELSRIASARRASEQTRAKMRDSAKHRPPRSEETKQKMSSSLKRAYKSEELRARIGAIHRGKIVSESTRELMRKNCYRRYGVPNSPEVCRDAAMKNKGRKRSDETKALMRERWEARKASPEYAALLKKMGDSSRKARLIYWADVRAKKSTIELIVP